MWLDKTNEEILNQFSHLRLVPVPTFVEGVESPVTSLCGEWNFQTEENQEIKSITVPSEWEMKGFNVSDNDRAIYTKNIEIKKLASNLVFKVQFDSVNSNAKVYFNGTFLGEHEGGFVPFEFDITNALKEGNNELRVEVSAKTISDHLGTVSQYAAHTVGGLLRKVKLVTLQSEHIKEFYQEQEFRNNYQEVIVKIKGKVSNINNKIKKLNIKLVDSKGKAYEGSFDVDNSGNFKGSIGITNPMLWNNEKPELYCTEYTLLVEDKVIQINKLKIGLREVKVQGNLVLLNGKIFKMLGVNRHDIDALNGRVVTKEQLLEEVSLFKEANCNYIRTSHYPPTEELLEICDELGVLVESEAPICWIKHHASPIWENGWDYLDEKYLEYFLKLNYQHIEFERNHPSIIIWSLANESRSSILWKKVNEFVKFLDSSRPTAFHDQCYGTFNNAGGFADIANFHYPNINYPKKSATNERPVIFGEYIHTTCYGRREVETDPEVKGDIWADGLVKFVDEMYKYPASIGGAIWSGIDDIFYKPNNTKCGYGPWGLIDGFRRKKPEFTGVRNAYTPVKVNLLKCTVGEKVSAIIEIENRYAFTKISEIDILFQSEKENKKISLDSDINEMSTGIVKVDFEKVNEFTIKIVDRNNLEVNRKVFIVDLEEVKISAEKEIVELVFNQKEDEINVKAGSVTYLFNDKEIVVLNKGNKIGSIEIPFLVPFNDDDGGAPHVAGNNYNDKIKPFDYAQLEDISQNIYEIVENSEEKISIKIVKDSTILSGFSIFTIDKYNEIEVAQNYTFKNKSIVRQFGILLELTEDFREIQWTRKGSFDNYCETDVQRNSGKVTISKDFDKNEEFKKEFKDEFNELGTNDFITTRKNIVNSTIRSNDSEIEVLGNGNTSTRSWISGDKVKYLIATHSGAGSCLYANPKIRVEKFGSLIGNLKFKINNK